MANTKSAKKAIRVSERKAEINSLHKKAMKDSRKAVMKAVSAGSKSDIEALLSKAFKEVDKAAKKNIIHSNAASRYKANLSKAVNSISK